MNIFYGQIDHPYGAEASKGNFLFYINKYCVLQGNNRRKCIVKSIYLPSFWKRGTWSILSRVKLQNWLHCYPHLTGDKIYLETLVLSIVCFRWHYHLLYSETAINKTKNIEDTVFPEANTVITILMLISRSPQVVALKLIWKLPFCLASTR